MRLYHVTTDLEHDGRFYPRVPEARLKGEEETIKRVSTSVSIEGCLTAMPEGGEWLEETLKKTGGKLRIFIIDTEKEGLFPSDLIPPFKLQKEGLVPDSSWTGEVWVMKPFKATKVIDVHLESWDEYIEDIVPEWQRDEEEKATDCPVITVIENASYKILV